MDESPKRLRFFPFQTEHPKKVEHVSVHPFYRFFSEQPFKRCVFNGACVQRTSLAALSRCRHSDYRKRFTWNIRHATSKESDTFPHMEQYGLVFTDALGQAAATSVRLSGTEELFYCDSVNTRFSKWSSFLTK